MTSPAEIEQALLDGLQACEQPATTREIERAMPIGLADEVGVAIERCRTLLIFRAIIEQDVRRLPDDRWELKIP